MDSHSAEKIISSDKPTFQSQELASSEITEVELINPSGHRQEVHRNWSLWSALAVGIVSGNCWTALAGTLTVAISNG